MNERLEHYDEAVYLHVWRGGHINSSHDWAFRFVVSQSLKEIEQTLDMMNILDQPTLRGG